MKCIIGRKYKVEKDITIGGNAKYSFFESEIYTVIELKDSSILLEGKIIRTLNTYNNIITRINIDINIFRGNFVSILEYNIDKLIDYSYSK